jgi:hypothetical protein
MFNKLKSKLFSKYYIIETIVSGYWVSSYRIKCSSIEELLDIEGTSVCVRDNNYIYYIPNSKYMTHYKLTLNDLKIYRTGIN